MTLSHMLKRIRLNLARSKGVSIGFEPPWLRASSAS